MACDAPVCPECGRVAARSDSSYCDRCGTSLFSLYAQCDLQSTLGSTAASSKREEMSIGPAMVQDILLQLESELGAMLGSSTNMSQSDVQIEGFRTKNGFFRESSACYEENCNLLRSRFAQHATIASDTKKEYAKDESDSSADEHSEHGCIKEVDIARIFNLQTSC